MDFINSAAVISLCRLDRYLALNGNDDLSEIAESYGNTDVSQFSEYISDNPMDFSESKKRYIRIISLFDDKFRVLAENFIDFSLMFRCIPDIPDDFYINIDMLLKINNISSNYGFISEFTDRLAKIIPLSENQRSVLKTNVCADSRFAGYLAGSDVQESIIKNICSVFSEKSDIHRLMINQDICGTAALMLKNRKSVLHIIGKTHTGKKFILRHAVRNIDRELLFTDFRLLMRYSSADISEALWHIKREALFYDRIVCWHNLNRKTLFAKGWEISEFAKLCIDNFIDDGVQICICSDDFIDFSYCSAYNVNTVSVNDADENQRIKLWRGFCDIYGSSVDYCNFAMRYKLSAGQISEVFRKKFHGCYDESLSETRIFDMICSQTGCSDEGLLHLRRSDYTFDDLKIPEFQMNTLKQICRNFENSYTVYNRWEMKKKFPYGRGLSVLLTGPPGTGKTMTACVMANTLRLPLYQADMSQITDKYIGETEKNIDALFSEAEKRNCVLFLDEADSLCGKRSEINDSKDKYANNDTAFVLQRIESFDGIVILATNYINNIDSAFMRRMKYVVQFSVPDAEIRCQIWKSAFTDKVSVSSDVDFQYLAEQFEFSGSNIKNIVLSAVFLSAAENTPVNMKHILTGVYNEYLKQQRHMFAVEFGKYEELYNQIIKQ